MKKLALVIAVAGIVGLSSCSKKGTECKLGANTITITDGEAESCTAGFCVDAPLGSLTEAEYIESLEALGYSCE